MNYGSFQKRLNTMWRTIVGETPNCSAMRKDFTPLACCSLIFRALAKVSFWARLGLVAALRLCAEWLLFSAYVAHARLANRLSRLSPFKWLTVGRSGSSGKKAKATSLWTNRMFPKRTRTYPRADIRIFTARFVTTCRTLPRSLTSYSGFSKMGFQFSTTNLRLFGESQVYRKNAKA
jgi:hypothetical protein